MTCDWTKDAPAGMNWIAVVPNSPQRVTRLSHILLSVSERQTIGLPFLAALPPKT
jgi:hypothetical protein